VHRPLGQPQRRAGGGGGRADGALHAVRQARGRHVDGLLEERPLQRVGLVEERQHVQRSPDQQAFQGDLEAGHVFLGKQIARGVAGHRDVVADEQRRDAPEGHDELLGGVGADDPAAGRQAQRLQHAGKRDAARGQHGVLAERDAPEARHRQARRGQALAHLELVARGGDGGRRAGPQSETLGDGGGSGGGDVIHADHGGQRAPGAPLDHARRGLGRVAEVEGQQAVGSERLERARLLGGTD